jgi:hypothetical protein
MKLGNGVNPLKNYPGIYPFPKDRLYYDDHPAKGRVNVETASEGWLIATVIASVARQSGLLRRKVSEFEY